MSNIDSDFLAFIRHVVIGDIEAVQCQLTTKPLLATVQARVGATRQDAADYFIREIAHYLYAGDTALHMAAAAFSRPVAELLISKGASCHARNRRGAEPLHYAADANHDNLEAQAETITLLLSAGANPNSLDKSGVTPLHRAIRTRSVPAVHALLHGGADPNTPNKSGSTPLDIAAHSSGRRGSGSEQAKRLWKEIVKLLHEAGAR